MLVDFETLGEHSKEIAYCYLKGNNYDTYKLWYAGNDELKEIEKTFDNYDDMMRYICDFSNYYSIAIQFYY